LVCHPREIISGVHVSSPAEEEFLERRCGARTQGINNASQGDLRKERLRARNGHKLELVRKYPRPVGNEMMPSEGYVGTRANDLSGEDRDA
jgi:hypothetical protein